MRRLLHFICTVFSLSVVRMCFLAPLSASLVSLSALSAVASLSPALPTVLSSFLVSFQSSEIVGMELWDTRPALGIISPESEDRAGVHTRLRVQTTCKHTWQDSPVRAGASFSKALTRCTGLTCHPALLQACSPWRLSCQQIRWGWPTVSSQ